MASEEVQQKWNALCGAFTDFIETLSQGLTDIVSNALEPTGNDSATEVTQAEPETTAAVKPAMAAVPEPEPVVPLVEPEAESNNGSADSESESETLADPESVIEAAREKDTDNSHA